MTTLSAPRPRLRGFALLSAEKMRQVASSGGTAAHRNGTAHQFTHAEAVAAAHKSIAARKAKKQ